MKKTKLLPLLLALPLLTSCGPGKIKAPKFQNSGKEVKFAVFYEALEKAYKKTVLGDSTKKFASGAIKREDKTYSETKANIGKKDVLIRKELSENAFNIKYDATNHIIEEKNDYTEVLTGKQYSMSMASKYDTHEKDVYQKYSKDKKDYAIRVNQESKEFYKAANLSKEYTLETFDNNNLREHFSDYIDEIMYACEEYTMLDKEEQNNFKFYQNENIFTIEYLSEEKEALKDEDEKKYADSIYKLTQKMQCDLTNDKLRFVSWGEIERTKTYTRDYTDEIDGVKFVFSKGDTSYGFSQTSEVVSFDKKDMKLKAVDLSKYTQMGAGW